MARRICGIILTMKYKCLIFDHDDTTVNSTATIHYPAFVEYMQLRRPDVSCTLDEYVRYNFHPGVIKFFRDICGLTKEEFEEEERFWSAYTKNHTAQAFPGIREIMERQKAAGGIITVASHSFADNILKDYRANQLPEPDAVFGWEQPADERKPSPVPVQTIMERFSLGKEDILVIDDLKPGFDMARAAGVDFAAACWCFDIPENEAFMQENADYCFRRVEDLAAMLFDGGEI